MLLFLFYNNLYIVIINNTRVSHISSYSLFSIQYAFINSEFTNNLIYYNTIITIYIYIYI